MTWEFRSPRGVLPHALVTIQIAFLPCFSCQKRRHAYCFFGFFIHSGSLFTLGAVARAACMRVPRAHTRVLVQLTSECAAGSVKASMLPCVSSQLSFVVFSQPVSGGWAVKV